MEAALRELLHGLAPLVALVPPEQIVWNYWPQGNPRPAVVLQKVNGAPGAHAGGSDRLTKSLVQIDVQARGVEQMWAIRDALHAGLHARPRIVVGTVSFQGIFLRAERQRLDDLTGAPLHTSQSDFEIWTGTTV